MNCGKEKVKAIQAYKLKLSVLQITRNRSTKETLGEGSNNSALTHRLKSGYDEPLIKQEILFINREVSCMGKTHYEANNNKRVPTASPNC